MDQKRLIKISKYLAKHLRHHPDRLGLTVDQAGWVGVDALLRACAAHSFPLTLDELNEVVARNDKRRFSFDATGTRIRANQGHSIAIDLELAPAIPPPLLFHGTGHGNVDSIFDHGLRRMGRHHVHLSVDPDAARKVGARHGRPAVFEVAAERMADDGYDFYVTDNDVWLTLEVPAAYLSVRHTP